MSERLTIEVRCLTAEDADDVAAAGHLFDDLPNPDATTRFLASDSHHLLIAHVAGAPAGFVSGIETIHPDKGAEMMVYELGVDPPFRRKGVGTALIHALLQLARDRGCYGMWAPTEPDDAAAVATYRAAGADAPEAAAIMTWEL